MRIPDDVVFKTKIQLALEMIERAVRNGIPGRIMLADSAYGDCTEFRNRVRELGFDFAVGVPPTSASCVSTGSIASTPGASRCRSWSPSSRAKRSGE